MVDKFSDPLLTPHDVARHLLIPPGTVYAWLNENVGGEPLVHAVRTAKRGWPSVPFIAVIEAYVLRSLRDLGLTKKKIRAAAADVRKEFETPYGLARSGSPPTASTSSCTTPTTTSFASATTSVRSGKSSATTWNISSGTKRIASPLD